MIMKKQLLSLALMLFGVLSAFAEEAQIGGLWYNLSGTTAKVIQWKNSVKYTGDIVIPSTVTYNNADYTVTSIGDDAFNNCWDLTSVTIPNSVTTIGRWVFNNCKSMTSVSIGNSVGSMGDQVFCNCTSLTTLTIPNSVKSIGNYAFQDCSSLTSISISCNVMGIGESVFSGCSSLTHLSIPNGVTSIGICAFRGCTGLTYIVLPSSLVYINDQAFESCTGLTDVYCYAETIPYTSNEIFMSTPINEVTLHVPAVSIEAYKEKKPWSDFKNFVALTDSDPKPANMSEVKISEGNATVAKFYTIDGKRISNPLKGINILRMSDGTSKKVVVK